MRRDHRPYYIKSAYLKLQDFYVRHFIKPRLEKLGKNFSFIKPWHVEIFGPSIEIGTCASVIAARDKPIRLAVWSETSDRGEIKIGNYCLICPGVRVGSGLSISIGDGSMIASGVYITDSDWHGVYNRISLGKAEPVVIEENVWIGDGSIVCKGLTIGKNSIIGAGSVVVKDIPQNTIAAGNPAQVVKQLDPDIGITTRSSWFSNPDKLTRDMEAMDREMLKGNSLAHWLRHILFPRRED